MANFATDCTKRSLPLSSWQASSRATVNPHLCNMYDVSEQHVLRISAYHDTETITNLCHTLLVQFPKLYSNSKPRASLTIHRVSFIQVALECVKRLSSGDRSIMQLGLPAIIIMISTVVIKGLCWFFCRLIPNSSVQALAQDAMTDIVFNIFSIIFPLGGSDSPIYCSLLTPESGIVCEALVA